MEHTDFGLKALFRLFFDLELLRPQLEQSDRGLLVLLQPLFLLLNLKQLAFVDDVFTLCLEFRAQTPQLLLVLPQECPLVDVLVDPRLVLDFLRSRREFKRAQTLREGIV